MPMWWFYFCIWFAPIAIVIIMALVGAWVVWEWKFNPRESKLIRWTMRKKVPLAFVASDDGFGDFEALRIRGKEGYAATRKKDSKREKKWTGFFARSVEEEPVKEGDENEKEKKIANFLNKLASRRLYFRDAKVPIFFGYSGKTILTSLYSLAGLSSVETIETNPTPLDILEIKSLFSKPWDQSQLRANEVDAKTEGILEGKKFYGENWKALVVPAGIILALVMGVIVLSAIFL